MRRVRKKTRQRPMAEQVPADHTKGQLHHLFGCSWLAWLAGLALLACLEWVVPTSLPKLLYRKLHRRAV